MHTGKDTGCPWWKGAVIYQIYPRSFQDSNADGVGDLRGITERLPYVADLGVDGIWLSPVFTSPMADFGYDISDYRDIDPVFGTLADFDALLARAHELGLKLIIDQVYGHTSDRHAWFEQSRASRHNARADWYVWADPKPDGTPPNNWPSVFGGPAWTWDTRRRQYYLHNFLAEQPDLNLHNPDVQDALLDVSRFWLERGVDGFRLDVANYYFHDPQLRDNPPSGVRDGARPYAFQRHVFNRDRPETPEFLERIRAVLDGFGARMSVAELESDDNLGMSVAYTRGSHRLHTAYNFHFLRTEDATPARVREALEAWQGVDAWPSWSLSNHDVVRAATRWDGGAGGSPERAKFLLALLLALRGTVFVYQGEELGLPQAHVPFERLRDPEAIRFWPDNMGRDGCRTPFPWEADAPHAGFSTVEPWLPASDTQAALAVDAQEGQADSVLAYARAALRRRSALPALVRGDVRFRDTGEAMVLAFEREDNGGGRVLCAFNFDARAAVEVDMPDAGEWRADPALSLGASLGDGTLRLAPSGCLFGLRAL